MRLRESTTEAVSLDGPPPPETGRAGRRRPRRLVVAAGALAVAVPLALVLSGGGGGDSEPAGRPVAVATTPVVRRTLVEQTKVEGSLGYAARYRVVNQLQGTFTGLADRGSVVERGQTLYEVDGRPVVLLFGARPAWRRLATGVADGPDVRQLEENLVALGHASADTLTVDDRFTVETTAAIKRWQKALGADQDGVVELGEVVFLPGAARVADHEVALGSGAQPGSEAMTATSTTRVVTVDLDARRQDLVRVGDAVEVELPDGRRTTGTVSAVGKVATTSSGGDDGDGSGGSGSGGDDEPTVEVTVALSDPAATGDLDQAPVDVHVSRGRAENALAVPVNALVALAEGGYAVEVAEGTRRRLVAVQTGLFANGMVEVSGTGLAEGTVVVVPR
ncbi:MAG: peptidoglycan-binding protein [Actinomycetota bacterium]|nr:peptidoglycan-binding protein [Actinomycetota bacterium]